MPVWGCNGEVPMTLMVQKNSRVGSNEFSSPVVEPLECRTLLSDGGGFSNAGLRGDYFPNATLSGTPAFTRNDVRVDFDWGLAAPGGSPDAPYNRVGADRFSVRWTGQVIPRYSQAYIFVVKADDGARLFVRQPGGTFRKLIDTFASGSNTATSPAPRESRCSGKAAAPRARRSTRSGSTASGCRR